MNLGELLFESNKDLLKDIFNQLAKKYESDNSYNIKRYYDGLELVGVSIYQDDNSQYLAKNDEKRQSLADCDIQK